MKIEVYGTIGPSCEREEIITKMFQAGMTGIRINMSHSGLSQCTDWIETIRKAAKSAEKTPNLLIDLKGPELRIGIAKDMCLTIEEKVTLVEEKEENITVNQQGNCREISVPRLVIAALSVGQEVLLDDGKILLLVEEGSVCRVLRGGILKSHKSIAVVGAKIEAPTLTQSDLDNIAQIKACHITGVMLPFVRNAQDIKNLRTALKNAGAEDTQIFAKIENRQGIAALPEILPEADQIVIARGDLGNDMPLWELPVVQNQIARICQKAGKPFMVVTQLLASMETHQVPTRAEVSDIFRAVSEGASSVMVTGETAVGNYPVETIRYLCNTVKAAQDYIITQ